MVLPLPLLARMPLLLTLLLMLMLLGQLLIQPRLLAFERAMLRLSIWGIDLAQEEMLGEMLGGSTKPGPEAAVASALTVADSTAYASVASTE